MTIEFQKPITGLEDVTTLEQKTPWENILSEDSIYELISNAAADRPDATAITFLPTCDLDESPIQITYRDFLTRINQTANMFQSFGVGKNDVVSFLIPNLPQTHFTMWGAATAGIANPINFLLQSDQIADLLIASNTKVLVALGPHPMLDIWQKVEAIRDQVPGLEAIIQVGPGNEDDGIFCFDKEISKYPGDKLMKPRTFSRDDYSVYFHTGGTTSSPKIAPHTHGNDIYIAWCVAKNWDYRPNSLVFNVLPMFHVAGSIIVSLTCFATAAELVILSPAGLRNPQALGNHWQLVEKYKPTHIGGVPTNLGPLVDSFNVEHDISSVKHTNTGGSTLPIQVEKQWLDKIGMQVSQIYGLTESGGAVAVTPVNSKAKIGSVGIRLPYSQIKIAKLNQDGSPGDGGAVNQTGLILLKSPGVFPGYLNAEQNINCFTDDGMLITGDLGFLDSEQCLHVTGRSKDLIIRSAHNIDPTGIEDAFLEHPAVVIAAAVGRPDDYAGELPVVYLQLKPKSKVTAKELLDFAINHISERPAVPKDVIIVESIPLTAVGKIFKPALRWLEVKRVFDEQLTSLANKNIMTSVEVVEHKQFGMLAKVMITSSHPLEQHKQIEDEIAALLNRYGVKHKVV